MNKLESEGWRLDSAETHAKITRIWKDENGEVATKQNKYIGTPEEVQELCGLEHKGEKIKYNDVHTFEDWSRERKTVTEKGCIKERETKTIQVNGFGSGASIEPNYKPYLSADSADDPKPKTSGLPDWFVTFKNEYDLIISDIHKRLSNHDMIAWVATGLALLGVGLAIGALVS